MGKKEQILLKIKNSIWREDPNAEIILYGSRARGTSSKMSDWDILVLTDKSANINETEDNFRNYLYDIELETGQVISTLVYSKDYWNNNLKFSPLYINVSNEGIRL